MKGGSRKGSGRKPIQIDERRAFTLFDQGFSKLEIANRFGVNYNSLRTIFRKAGKLVKRKPDEQL
jgi:DNA invertase Pin-like site-specific DNA recombinase